MLSTLLLGKKRPGAIQTLDAHILRNAMPQAMDMAIASTDAIATLHAHILRNAMAQVMDMAIANDLAKKKINYLIK